MALSTDQVLLYGGALLALAALLWLVGCLVHFHAADRRLNRQLDAEYGKPKQHIG